jgi:hypothetical protein
MEYTITLTPQELQILSAALVEMPFKVAAPLIGKIDRQINEQNEAQNNKE